MRYRHKARGLVLGRILSFHHWENRHGGAGDRDLLNGAQVLCFQFHTLCIMITASESLAFQTGLYKLGKFEEHFLWNGGRSWLQEEKDEETRKDKREERGDKKR